jgi:hypothetical protein
LRGPGTTTSRSDGRPADLPHFAFSCKAGAGKSTAAQLLIDRFLAGPTIVDAVHAGGMIAVSGLILLLVGGVVVETVRRHRRSQRCP